MKDATFNTQADAPQGALYTTVVDEHSTVEAFSQVLACEEQALCSATPLETLPPIIDSKTELAEKLARLEQRRDALLSALGLPPGYAGMDAAAAADARLAHQWTLLRQSAGRACARNATNGMLIRVRMDYNRRALDALRTAPATQDLYGPDGRLAALG